MPSAAFASFLSCSSVFGGSVSAALSTVSTIALKGRSSKTMASRSLLPCRRVCRLRECSGYADRTRDDGPDPTFGHVANLIACHCGKIFTKEQPPRQGGEPVCAICAVIPSKKLWLSSVES